MYKAVRPDFRSTAALKDFAVFKIKATTGLKCLCRKRSSTEFEPAQTNKIFMGLVIIGYIKQKSIDF